MTNDYLLIKNFLSHDQITEIKNIISNKKEKYGKVGKKIKKRNKIRKDVYFSKKECSNPDKYIFERVKKIVNNKFNFNLKYREKYKVGTYYANEKGFYTPHTDKQGGMEHRDISIIICLSKKDDYQGGFFKLAQPVSEDDKELEQQHSLDDDNNDDFNILHPNYTTSSLTELLRFYLESRDLFISDEKFDEMIKTDKGKELLKHVNLNKKFKFDYGDIIIFKSELLHCVEPVTKGARQVLIFFSWTENSNNIRIKNKRIENENEDNKKFTPVIL